VRDMFLTFGMFCVGFALGTVLFRVGKNLRK